MTTTRGTSTILLALITCLLLVSVAWPIMQGVGELRGAEQQIEQQTGDTYQGEK